MRTYISQVCMLDVQVLDGNFVWSSFALGIRACQHHKLWITDTSGDRSFVYRHACIKARTYILVLAFLGLWMPSYVCMCVCVYALLKIICHWILENCSALSFRTCRDWRARNTKGFLFVLCWFCFVIRSNEVVGQIKSNAAASRTATLLRKQAQQQQQQASSTIKRWQSPSGSYSQLIASGLEKAILFGFGRKKSWDVRVICRTRTRIDSLGFESSVGPWQG